MRQSINVQLRGFLDLFRLRNNGANPQVVAEFMQPMINLERWYLESQVVEYSTNLVSTAVNTPGTTRAITSTTPTDLVQGAGNLVVPQNELWLLLPGTRVTSTYSTAGTSGEAVLSATGSGGVVSSILPFGPLIGHSAGQAGASIGGWRVLDQPYFVVGGSTIAMIHRGVIIGGAGTAEHVALLRLVRLKA